MKKYAMETWVGIFVLAGLLCVAYLTVKLGKLDITDSGYYSVEAVFGDVSGLVSGAWVEMSGVRVGKVDSIALDPKTENARVRLKIRREVVLTGDVIASIKTSGLIGDKYVKLSPGGAGAPLKQNSVITDTESAVDIGDLIAKYVFGGVK
ncbi:MAG: outer membrane lipid asymmetry maintenance protein MlaD [Desulfovibrionaceae bacterium]|nr:outer membrane lipid asymmetry maintenance protein MlaD [Desulfovibrionaceae bacterium]MBF0514936.1 outer membrane lipid asymmetry maintenance protein MlaD [Desulfovibrionaceae bacterium]